MGPFPGCEKRCSRKSECEHGCPGFDPSPRENRAPDCQDPAVFIVVGDLSVRAETLDQALYQLREELKPWRTPR